MYAEIIAIGTEILMGEIVDTNSAYLAAELVKSGIQLRWVSQVGDDPDRLFEAVDRAWKRSDVTLTTGGLGPTSDDMTRETIAEVMGEEMTVDNDLLEHLKGLFVGRGFSMPDTNIKQATLIPSADSLSNPLGTAPGWWVEKNEHIIIAMPGPPRELKRMWTHEVVNRLTERNPGVAIVTKTFKTFGISEGGLDRMVAPLFESSNPSLGIYSRDDGIHLRVVATAATEDKARELIVPMEGEIRKIAGEAVWGEDDETPETQVASLLIRSGQTLGVVESFTGGLLASNLAGLPNSLDFFSGSIVANNSHTLVRNGVKAAVIEQFGLVSVEVAEAMAEAARRHFRADVGIGVTGVVADSTPDNGPIGMSYVGFAIGHHTNTVSGYYPSRRLHIRSRAATQALLELIRLLKVQVP